MAASATARKTTTTLQQAAVLLMMCVWATAATTSSGGGGAAAPAVDCSSLVLTMADCLSFVSNGSTVEKPEGTCCSGLKTVLKADAECICEAFRNSAQLGVILNVTKAMALPAACKVSASSATNCQLSVAPASSPDTPDSSSSPTADSSSSSTAASPSSTGTDQQVASDEVSAPAPAPAQGLSASSSLTPSFASLHIFSLLLAALFFFST